MRLQEFQKKAKETITELRNSKLKEATIVHHDDADGLCSAAITKMALERQGIKAKTFCLEKIYREVIEDLHSKAEQTIFYVDIGSPHADMISGYNEGRNLTIILDHHDPKPSKDPRVLDLNLEHFGFKGETDFSASTCCYLFAKTLSNSNMDLSYLALVGSCEIPEGFQGINKMVLKEALINRVVQRKGKGFEVMKFKTRIENLFSKLQILGAVGYYESGPEIGISVCLKGLSKDAKERANALEDRRKNANRKLLGRLYRERLKETEYIQWFDAGNMYAGMGTKVIGQFCSFLSYKASLIRPDKYVLVFMNVPLEIPGWGKLKENFVKASVRLPKPMCSQIKSRKLLGAVDLLTEAAKDFGIADGHQYAASVVVPTNRKKTLIENAEKAIESTD